MSILNTLLKTFGSNKSYVENALNNSFKVYKNHTFVYEYKNNASDSIWFTEYYKVIRLNNIAYYFHVYNNCKVTRVKMLRDSLGNPIKRIYGCMSWLNLHLMGHNEKTIYVGKYNISKLSRPRPMKKVA